MRQPTRRILLAFFLVAALTVFFLLSRRSRSPEPGPERGKLVARFLDVGQGDSELIYLPDGEAALIDSGDRGAPTVELLRNYGVRQIRLVIATHPHSDHIGEMRDILRSFKVDEFWDSGFNHPTRTYGDMLEEIRDRGVKFATPKRGFSSEIGGVLFEVLNPPEQPLDDQPNNASIVVRLTYGDTRMLFAGDAEVRAWAEMFAANTEGLAADLLKAAHHGSSNGTTRQVLDAVRPSIVVVSCGRGNDYHHPHPNFIRLLRETPAVSLFRTDLQGTVSAISDGKGIDVGTERTIGADRLYLTGDEVAGKLASDGGSDGGSRRKHARGGK